MLVPSTAARTALERTVAALTHEPLAHTGGRQMWVVAGVVREAVPPSLGAASLDALLHDAGRCCVEAYFAA